MDKLTDEEREALAQLKERLFGDGWFTWLKPDRGVHIVGYLREWRHSYAEYGWIVDAEAGLPEDVDDNLWESPNNIDALLEPFKGKSVRITVEVLNETEET